MVASECDVESKTSFPREHWSQSASTHPLENVNRRGKQRADFSRIFLYGDAPIDVGGTQ
jgi:transposase-like protein